MSRYYDGRDTDGTDGKSDVSGNPVSELEVKLLISESDMPPTTPKRNKWLVRGVLGLGVIFVVLMVTFLAIIPAVIRSQIKSSSIAIIQTNVIGPTNTSFRSLVIEQFDRGSPVPTTIHFKSMRIEWEGEGGGTLVHLSDLPDITVSTDPIEMDALATVANVTALTNFNYFAINNAETTWRIRSNADVTALSVKTNVDIDKTATMRGFDNFPLPPHVNNLTTLVGFPTCKYNPYKYNP